VVTHRCRWLLVACLRSSHKSIVNPVQAQASKVLLSYHVDGLDLGFITFSKDDARLIGKSENRNGNKMKLTLQLDLLFLVGIGHWDGHVDGRWEARCGVQDRGAS
jgi:hypothetical protein